MAGELTVNLYPGTEDAARLVDLVVDSAREALDGLWLRGDLAVVSEQSASEAEDDGDAIEGVRGGEPGVWEEIVSDGDEPAACGLPDGLGPLAGGAGVGDGLRELADPALQLRRAPAQLLDLVPPGGPFGRKSLYVGEYIPVVGADAGIEGDDPARRLGRFGRDDGMVGLGRGGEGVELGGVLLGPAELGGGPGRFTGPAGPGAGGGLEGPKLGLEGIEGGRLGGEAMLGAEGGEGAQGDADLVLGPAQRLAGFVRPGPGVFETHGGRVGCSGGLSDRCLVLGGVELRAGGGRPPVEVDGPVGEAVKALPASGEQPVELGQAEPAVPFPGGGTEHGGGAVRAAAGGAAEPERPIPFRQRPRPM